MVTLRPPPRSSSSALTAAGIGMSSSLSDAGTGAAMALAAASGAYQNVCINLPASPTPTRGPGCWPAPTPRGHGRRSWPPRRRRSPWVALRAAAG